MAKTYQNNRVFDCLQRLNILSGIIGILLTKTK